MGKRLMMILALFVCGFAGVWADEIDEKQAEVFAQKFVSRHFGRKGGSSDGIKQLGTVNGLYVFSMSEKGGFVIVSNDNKTKPILGFSDKGTIDTKNIPDNMRAWLQGYADEIAWVQKNGSTKTSEQNKARKKAGTHNTTAISPLLGAEDDANKIKWNQGNPYNAAVVNKTGSNFVTGCVATAMAQVMYYTETKAHNATTSTTAQIPGYTTNGLSLGAIAASSVINWGNMINDYSGNYNATQADAVAWLMYYCGCSVQMNYGPSSSAYISDVPNALTTYFGYESTTTQYISRSFYSYDDWTDIIYHELDKGRPVLYGGQSTDNGHAFVCDGYKFENNTDLFHINWGWGGQSDGYFVLSVLNPDEQGIGGSATNSAYNTGQEAVIGIQKSSNSPVGVSGLVTSGKITIDLTVKSITLSNSTIALGESVNVTIKVTNNSDKAYDGEICLALNNSLGQGKMFKIAAKATQDCVITYTPKETGEITIYAALPSNNGNYYWNYNPSATLTVVDLTPTDIAAVPTNQSALVSWTGYTDSYKVKYRTAAIGTVTFTEDFEYWNSKGWTLTSGSGIYYFQQGNNFAGLGFSSTETQYLITPELSNIENGTTVNFYQRFYQSGTTFKVGFSSTTSDIGVFTWGSEQTAASSFTLYSEVIPNGTKYIAIQTTATAEAKALLIDDFSIGTVTPAGDWTTVTTDENSVNITGLTANTSYDYQVIGVENNTEVVSSDILTFTTAATAVLELTDDDTSAGIKNADLIAAWNGITANVTLSGRKLWKDGGWNTFCVPFNMTADQVTAQLAPTKLMTLSATELDGSTLKLTFADATTIEAGKPYIIKWTGSSGNYVENPSFTGVTISNTKANVITDKATFTGTYTPLSYNDENKEVIFLGDGSTLYYPDGSDPTTIGAFRAYFTLNGITAGESTDSGQGNVRAFVLNFGDNETGIENVQSSMFNVQSNDAWYSLDGRRLEGKPTKKGVYLNNGHKVIIK